MDFLHASGREPQMYEDGTTHITENNMNNSKGKGQFFGKDSKHGFAKRVILHKTLQGWFRYYYSEGFKRTCYIDGFSGAGSYGCPVDSSADEYDDVQIKPERTTNTNVICKYGSPLIALHNVQDTFMTLDAYLKKQETRKNVTIDELVRAGINDAEWCDLRRKRSLARYRPPFRADIVMVEPNRERLIQLRDTMQERDPIDDEYDHSIMKYWPHYVQDTFQEASEMIEERFLQKKCTHPLRGLVELPTFSFIDPFGYKQIPMSIVKKYIGEHKTVLINVMVGFMYRFRKLENHRTIINDLYGCADWESIPEESLDPTARYLWYAKLYENQLKQNGATYTLSFAMRDERNHLKYYLIFATNDFRILKTAKEALNKVTQEMDCFKFSAYYIRKNKREMEWKNDQDPSDLADFIWKEFRGKDPVSVEDIECYVYKSDTPYIHKQTALKILYEKGKVSYVEGCEPRGKGTFPHNKGILVKFAATEDEALAFKCLHYPLNANEEAKGIFYKYQGQTSVPVFLIKPKWKQSLKILLDTHRLYYDRNSEPKRRGNFPDDVLVSFSRIRGISDFDTCDINNENIDLIAPPNTVCKCDNCRFKGERIGIQQFLNSNRKRKSKPAIRIVENDVIMILDSDEEGEGEERVHGPQLERFPLSPRSKCARY